jgi:hypothetical protein
VVHFLALIDEICALEKLEDFVDQTVQWLADAMKRKGGMNGVVLT